jgi:thiol-activated cytolysin
MKTCLPALCLAFALGCSASPSPGDDDPIPDPDEGAAIDELVRGIEPLPSEPPSRVEGRPGESARRGDYLCAHRPVTETRQHEELVAFAANSEAMWPGALVRGDSVGTGLFTQIVRSRAPVTISVSLENLDGHRSAVMEKPSLSSFREAVGPILAQELTGATPANLFAEIEAVYSEDQLAMALGASVSVTGLPAQLAASFDFSAQDVKSRYLVKYVQSYYTVDIDQPESPSEFFGADVTAPGLADVVGDGNPPLYVSSVTFGRVVLFTFESSYSATELGSALEFVYSGGADVSGDVSVSYRDIVSQSNITAYILGGSGGEAARSLGSYEDLMDFIGNGGDYSRMSPGAPIAYKLAYLSDNQPARLSFTDEYDEVECERVSQKVLIQLKKIEVVAVGGEIGEGGGLEVYGAIQATGSEGPTVIFERPRDERIEIAEGQSWPQDGSVAEVVVHVEPRAGSILQLGALLHDRDELLGDELLGDESTESPFETGWRKDVTLHLTGGGSQVAVTLSLAPI